MANETIDWDAVAAAQRRGKYGTMRPGDQELCEVAWEADRERYREQALRIRDEVTREVCTGLPCKGGG